MKRKVCLDNDKKPIVVFNTEVPEPIAIFRDRPTLIKYLAGGDIHKEAIRSNIYSCLNKQTKTRKSTTRLNLHLTFRNATGKYLDMLGEQDYLLIVDYIPKVPFNMLLGYTSTRIDLAKEHTDPERANHPNSREALRRSGNKNFAIKPYITP